MSDEQQDLAGVMRRVRKLLAIAQDHRADPNEAAAAASQAERIMRKYQLDHADVIAEQLKADKGAVVCLYVFGNMKKDVPNRPPLRENPLWCQHLAVAVARFTDCEVRQGYGQRPGSNPPILDRCVEIYGYAQDAQVAQWMYDYLVDCMVRAARDYRVPVFLGVERRKPTKQEGNEFRRGYVAAVCARLREMANRKKAELLTAQAGTALVVAKKQALEEQFGAFEYRETKRASIRDSESFAAGVRQGDKVDLNRRGLNGEQQAQSMLAR